MSATDSGDGACSRADFSSRWGCGRRVVACCDSVAEQCETAQGGVAVGDCSRSTRAHCSVKTDWPLLSRSNYLYEAKSQRARSSRRPSPERKRTVTTSPSSGHFPSLPRRLVLAVSPTQPPAAALLVCNTRRDSPWSLRFELQSYVGG